MNDDTNYKQNAFIRTHHNTNPLSLTIRPSPDDGI